MNFTYKIENYYPSDGRLFVVYTPEDASLLPLGGWVHVDPSMTAQGIYDAIVAAVPSFKEVVAHSSVAEALVGEGGSGVKAAVVDFLPTPEQVEAMRISSLWRAAYMYEYAAISGTVIGLITMGVMMGKPKAIAVQAWITGIWTEYYSRKASGSTDFEFTSVGPIPHTVPELAAELAA